MSIPVMRAVVDSERYGGLRKLVLLALAAYSDRSCPRTWCRSCWSLW